MNRLPRPLLRNRIKLRHLMLIEALSHDPSLHGAASRMHMTQPNATRLLAELEEMLGARLYERSARGLLATPYGQAVTEQARLLLSNVDQIEHTMQSLLDGHTGLVRVGIQTFWGGEGTPPRVLALEIAPVIALIGLIVFLTIKADVALGYMRETARALLQPSIYAEGVLGAPRAADQEDGQ